MHACACRQQPLFVLCRPLVVMEKKELALFRLFGGLSTLRVLPYAFHMNACTGLVLQDAAANSLPSVRWLLQQFLSEMHSSNTATAYNLSSAVRRLDKPPDEHCGQIANSKHHKPLRGCMRMHKPNSHASTLTQDTPKNSPTGIHACLRTGMHACMQSPREGVFVHALHARMHACMGPLHAPQNAVSAGKPQHWTSMGCWRRWGFYRPNRDR